MRNKPGRGQVPPLLASLGLFLLALAPRLPGLDVFLTADEPKSWFGRSIMFLGALARADWAATYDSPAPGVTTMWSGAIGLLLEYVRQGLSFGIWYLTFGSDSLIAFLTNVPFDPLDPAILPLIRLPVVLIAALAVPLTYLWSQSFLGKRGAALAALLLALDPFLLALSRVLGHDALVALFMWLSLLAFLHADQGTGLDRRFVAISGAFGGLAFLTKYPSLFLGVFVVLTMAILRVATRLRPFGRRQPLRQAIVGWLVDGAIWSAAAGLVFVVLWPTMWVDPLGRVIAIINDALRASGSPHPKGSFFLGQPVPDPGLSFYGLVTLFRTTPLLWVGWAALAVTALFNAHTCVPSGKARRRRENIKHQMGNIKWVWHLRFGIWCLRFGTWWRPALVLLAFVLTYGLLVTLGGKKQDRYILPIFPALAVLAAMGYARLADFSLASTTGHFVNNRPLCKRILAPAVNWLLAAVVLIQAILVLPHFPYYFTYYNPLMGGGQAAVRAMIVGWGEGLDRAAGWLNTLPDVGRLKVVSWYSTTFEPFFRGNAIYKVEEEKISRTPKPGLAADYVVLYVNQVQRQLPSAGALQFFRSVAPVHTVTLHGIEYAWIYPSAAMQYVIAGDARLVGQAELLGYDLKDEAGRPVTGAYPDSVAYLSLYWEWQGKSQADPIRISLLDVSGKTRGWGNVIRTVAPLPYAEWQDGMVVHDDFALAVFADTPPGDYQLAAWIERPSTGETVGVFPTGEVKIRVESRGNRE